VPGAGVQFALSHIENVQGGFPFDNLTPISTNSLYIQRLQAFFFV
jgi:hypothetical protein